MNTSKILWAAVAIVAVLLGAFLIAGRRAEAPADPVGNGQNQATSGAPVGQNSGSASKQTIGVYFIDVEGKTAPGAKIGCGDVPARVIYEIEPTAGVLRAALEKLIGTKDRQVFMGEFEYYNALYQSDLALNSASIVNGVAEVRLSGTLQSGGTCDDPRIIAQLRETIEQFPTVRSSKIYINNVLIEDYFSQR